MKTFWAAVVAVESLILFRQGAFGGAYAAVGRADDLLPMPQSVRQETAGMLVVSGHVEDVSAACTHDTSIPPEGYRLTIGPSGVAIASSDDAGAFYARQTLAQLAETRDDKTSLPHVEIVDAPAYRWRGVLVDEARHFIGPNAVKRLLRTMARYKFNVLHWHLTDETGWRLEIKSKPRLTTVGATRPWSPVMWHYHEHDNVPDGPHFYTQEQVREIVALAASLHITVVPEIEFPGHALAALAAYPELSCLGAASPVKHPEQCYVFSPHVYCPGKDTTLSFLRDVLDEVCELFPSPYVHIGGDESVKSAWEACPHCQARMRREKLADVKELHGWMMQYFARYLASKGKQAVAWDEVLETPQAKDVLPMCWHGSAAGVAAAMAGRDVIMTPPAFCYVDYPQGVEDDPFEYIKGSLLNLEKVYSFDPAAGFPSECKGRILGGQACNWGEFTWHEFDFNWKLWPRALALAEVLWTAPKERDFGRFSRRAAVHRKRLIASGVNCAPLK